MSALEKVWSASAVQAMHKKPCKTISFGHKKFTFYLDRFSSEQELEKLFLKFLKQKLIWLIYGKRFVKGIFVLDITNGDLFANTQAQETLQDLGENSSTAQKGIAHLQFYPPFHLDIELWNLLKIIWFRIYAMVENGSFV